LVKASNMVDLPDRGRPITPSFMLWSQKTFTIWLFNEIIWAGNKLEDEPLSLDSGISGRKIFPSDSKESTVEKSLPPKRSLPVI